MKWEEAPPAAGAGTQVVCYAAWGVSPESESGTERIVTYDAPKNFRRLKYEAKLKVIKEKENTHSQRVMWV